jgi:catechol 2,3-dioxygenase-like lactoylglutathione lyase family enzyme
MCRDVAASLKFYGRLGFRAVFADDPGSPRYAVIQRDSVQLHLQWGDATQWEPAIDRPTYRFLVDDPDGLYAELVDCGVETDALGPWRAPSDTPWGTREFHIRDPGGNALQFYRATRRSENSRT